ncbi:hypothetical protein PASE110613_14605 [Paenibacillus sediminis]|uniref:Uncharacterized protein n=1 Tax=Paenibacillus sediminis TaxID=664909 RepID=A0ABS4H7Z9_9BACL|nr:hypothetical protein [Paenibacillus sediminis]MBP1938649.1 hypothetical protein [Paenibacillus sediminis]
MISTFLKMLFYPGSNIGFSEEELNEFSKVYEQAVRGDGLVHYQSPFPKYRFLQYLCTNKDLLCHGSNNKDISEFVPKRQTLYNGEYVDAVFATSDGIWPIFYAVFDRSKLVNNFRNGCFEHNNKRYYFFSLSTETMKQNPWTDGMVYLFPKERFNKVGKGIVIFDEWVSKEPAKSLLRLEVNINDFIYLHKVSKHPSDEAFFKTLLLYKLRTRKT